MYGQSTDSDGNVEIPAGTQTVVIQNQKSSIAFWLVLAALVMSIGLCIVLFFALAGSLALSGAEIPTDSVIENYESGNEFSSEKVAIIDIVGAISPPLTGRVIHQAEHAAEDDDVKAVLLRVDSPGGFVADSHQIYHKLKQLSDLKPVYVSFGRLAASGGYYVAMGAGPDGKIFTEPTTWTGSIGVIIPHYEADQLAEEWGVEFKPLTTGPYKDALSPFKDLKDDELAVWNEILDDAFVRFRGVIEDNRSQMTPKMVLEAATGQIFTAGQALERKLVDAEGFEEDALETLLADHGLEDAHVVRYGTPPTLFDVLSGSVEMNEPRALGESLRKRLATVMTPQPLYLFGWPNAEL